ncbi:hypothetical protein J2Z81_002924 [Virgibacillus campisalis]|uniref:Uncharacterized protein n=1 Tax=Virgibacillus alimentarius TaxID=698769 RepID=A0ABS4SBQ0_9BACI|nr:hypothetical protein [Virgibacillus alimentarius]
MKFALTMYANHDKVSFVAEIPTAINDKKQKTSKKLLT